MLNGWIKKDNYNTPKTTIDVKLISLKKTKKDKKTINLPSNKDKIDNELI